MPNPPEVHCECIDEEQAPAYAVVPIGPHRRLVVCKECWDTLRAVFVLATFERVLEEGVRKELLHRSGERLI